MSEKILCDTCGLNQLDACHCMCLRDLHRWKGLAERMAEALEKIYNGKFHIGNDEHGNIIGPPDAVMCRNIAQQALSDWEAAKTK